MRLQDKNERADRRCLNTIIVFVRQLGARRFSPTVKLLAIMRAVGKRAFVRPNFENRASRRSLHIKVGNRRIVAGLNLLQSSA